MGAAPSTREESRPRAAKDKKGQLSDNYLRVVWESFGGYLGSLGPFGVGEIGGKLVSGTLLILSRGIAPKELGWPPPQQES